VLHILNFLICCVLDHLNHILEKFLQLQISVVMFICGKLMGAFFINVLGDEIPFKGKGLDNLVQGIQDATFLNPHALLYIILPPLLYESASAMNWHVLRKVLPSCAVLAIPGMMINTLFTGFIVKGVVRINNQSPTWEASWLLSAILSATDPVAVVAALASLGAPAKLSALVEGESLLNDGSAVVLAYVLRDWVVGQAAPDDQKNCPGSPPAAGCVIGYFLQVAGGGVGIGLVCGGILLVWLSFARSCHSVSLEMSLVILTVYGSFFLAESFHISGVLAVVTVGMMIAATGNSGLSHEGRHAHHVLLSQIAYACNQITFFGAGLISARFMWWDGGCDHFGYNFRAWLELITLYIACHATRAFVLAMFSPLLCNIGYGLNLKESVIMVYGGLRGAVGLIMGLIIEHNSYIDSGVKQMISFHTSGIVLLTLAINGSTIDNLYRWLDIYKKCDYHETHLRKLLGKLEERCQKDGYLKFRQQRFFADLSWKSIIVCVPNFKSIDFNDARMPYFTGISPVRKTLCKLEVMAHHKSLKALRSGLSFDNQNFEVKWQEHKVEKQQQFLDFVSNNMDVSHHKDELVNLHNSGDSVLQLEDCSKGTMGFYLSVRSLETLSHEQGRDNLEDPHFTVQISRLEYAVISVGLAFSRDGPPTLDLPDNDILLGSQLGTMAFCSDSLKVLHNFSGNVEEISPEDNPQPCQVHEFLRVQLRRKDGEDPKIVVSVRERNRVEPRWTWSFPISATFASASMLYPAVQLARQDRLGERKSTCDGPMHAVAHLPGAVFEALHGVTGAARDMMMSTGSEVTTSQGLDLRQGHSAESRKSVVPVSHEVSEHRKTEVKVKLSFEPQIADISHSIQDVFRVLFNTMNQTYHSMHDHGVLCDQALFWLSESIGRALDRSTGEAHATKACELVRTIVKKPSDKSMVSRMSKSIKSLAEHDDGSMGLFEPLLVEYLSLEVEIAQASMFDRLPRTWNWTRSFGYYNTRIKVEALWAFIQAHVKAMNELPALKRFPKMGRCIEKTVEVAWYD